MATNVYNGRNSNPTEMRNPMSIVRISILCLTLVLTSTSSLAWSLQSNEDEVEDTTYSFIFSRAMATKGFRWSNQADTVFLLVDCNNDVTLHTGTNALEGLSRVTIRFDKGLTEDHHLVAFWRKGSQYLVFDPEFGQRLVMESGNRRRTLLIRYREQDVVEPEWLPPPTFLDFGIAMSNLGSPNSTTGSLDSILGPIKYKRHNYNVVTLKFDLADFADAYEELRSVCGQ